MADKSPVRRFVACLAVLSVVGLALLPPEHVHETEADDGSHSEVVHRHFEPHHHFNFDPADHSVTADRRLDHEDGAEARWLDSLFITSDQTLQFHRVDRFVARELPASEPLPSSLWTPSCPEISGHDPPWAIAVGLRAPPTLLV